jgi:hypothetical protein
MAKQAETTAYENVRSNPFTRVHGRPTRSDYEILKSEAGTLASEVEDITYAWSKNNKDNYGLLGNILGEDEYKELTGIGTYTIPTEPVSYDPTITNATFTHERKRKRKSGSSSEPHGSSERVSSGASSITYAMLSMSSTTHN